MKTSVNLRNRRRRIDVADVMTALETVVAEDPNHVDRRAKDGLPARYVDRGAPNCLVARVLAELGFSLGVLRSLDQEHPTGDLFHVGVRVQDSRHAALRKIDPLAMRLLAFVQTAQDRGEKWGAIARNAVTPDRWFPKRDRERKPWLVAV